MWVNVDYIFVRANECWKAISMFLRKRESVYFYIVYLYYSSKDFHHRLDLLVWNLSSSNVWVVAVAIRVIVIADPRAPEEDTSGRCHSGRSCITRRCTPASPRPRTQSGKTRAANDPSVFTISHLRHYAKHALTHGNLTWYCRYKGLFPYYNML